MSLNGANMVCRNVLESQYMYFTSNSDILTISRYPHHQKRHAIVRIRPYTLFGYKKHQSWRMPPNQGCLSIFGKALPELLGLSISGALRRMLSNIPGVYSCTFLKVSDNTRRGTWGVVLFMRTSLLNLSSQLLQLGSICSEFTVKQGRPCRVTRSLQRSKSSFNVCDRFLNRVDKVNPYERQCSRHALPETRGISGSICKIWL